MESLANRRESTRASYLRLFRGFLEYTGKTADELRQLKYEEDLKEKPWERSRVENLVRGYLQHLGEKGLKSLEQPYYAITSFFSCNGLHLNLNTGDAPKNHSSRGSSVATPEDTRRVLDACDYIRDRGMVLFLKDSGLRASDLPQLKWRDLKPYGEGFLAFELITTKERVLARGFVGPETTPILMLYKKKRVEGTRRILPEMNIEDHPVFADLEKGERPMKNTVISARLSYIFQLAGMRERDVSAHGLRKFWEQNVHAKKESYVKQLNGRALSKVEKAYDWLTREQLFEIYQSNYDNLRVLSRSIAKEVQALEERLRREYELKIAEERGKREELEKQLSGLREQMTEIQSLLLGPGPGFKFETAEQLEEFLEGQRQEYEELKAKGLLFKIVGRDRQGRVILQRAE